MSLAIQVGQIKFKPSKLTYDDFITVENSILANSGFQAIKLEGVNLPNPDLYPYAKAVLGIVFSGGLPFLPIPDMRGKITIGSGTYQDFTGTTKSFVSGVESTEGEYSHKLSRAEMYHFHVAGGRESLSRAAFFRNEQLTEQRDLTGMTDYDNDEVLFSEFIYRDTLEFGPTVDDDNRFVTTLNDNDPAVLAQRIAHNNIQPCVGSHAYMIIDNPG